MRGIGKYIAVIALILFSTTAFAQRLDPKDLLNDVRKNYSTLASFSSDFVFEIDIPEADLEVMQGKLYLKGEKYKLELDNQEIISDNVNLWQWIKDINEVQVDYVEGDEKILSPSDIFSFYMKGFGYKLITETTLKGKKLALIEIVPSGKDVDYFKVKVVVDKVNRELEQMQIFYKDGTVYTFSMKNLEPVQLADNFFRFSTAEYPNVEVVDLR